MENEIRSPREGRVKDVLVRERQAVETAPCSCSWSSRRLGAPCDPPPPFVAHPCSWWPCRRGRGLARCPPGPPTSRARLGAFFGRPVTVGSVRYRSSRSAPRSADLRVAGPPPADPPFLEVPLLVAAPSLRPLWERGSTSTSCASIGPRDPGARLPEGGDDIPQLRSAGPAGLRGPHPPAGDPGRRAVGEPRARPPGPRPARVRGPATAGRAGPLGGRLAFGPGDARFGDDAPGVRCTTMDLAVRGGDVDRRVRALARPRTDLVYRGQVQPRAASAPTSSSRAPSTSAIWTATCSGPASACGRGALPGLGTLEGSRMRLGGRLSGTDGRFDGIAGPALRRRRGLGRGRRPPAAASTSTLPRRQRRARRRRAAGAARPRCRRDARGRGRRGPGRATSSTSAAAGPRRGGHRRPRAAVAARPHPRR